MKLHIPENIIVGFQSRSDTLDGSLSFMTYKAGNVIYNAGKFNRWIDNSIPVQEYYAFFLA